MKWERPDFVEIGMNAEIGGYQSDFGVGEPAGPRNPVVGGAPASQASTVAEKNIEAPRAS